jgi:hypothetical protein
MKNEIKISDSKSLKEFLAKIVGKSVSEAFDVTRPYSLKEQNKLPDFLQPESEEEETKSPEAAPEEIEATSEEDVEVEEVEEEDLDATPKSLFRLINAVRSGKSIKGGDVRDQLRTYFENLDEPEQMALIEFLQGLSDIIVRGETAEDAEDPSDEVKMISKIKADIVDVEKSEKQTPPEDTSPPIKVKGA